MRALLLLALAVSCGAVPVVEVEEEVMVLPVRAAAAPRFERKASNSILWAHLKSQEDRGPESRGQGA